MPSRRHLSGRKDALVQVSIPCGTGLRPDPRRARLRPSDQRGPNSLGQDGAQAKRHAVSRSCRTACRAEPARGLAKQPRPGKGKGRIETVRHRAPHAGPRPRVPATGPLGLPGVTAGTGATGSRPRPMASGAGWPLAGPRRLQVRACILRPGTHGSGRSSVAGKVPGHGGTVGRVGGCVRPGAGTTPASVGRCAVSQVGMTCREGSAFQGRRAAPPPRSAEPPGDVRGRAEGKRAGGDWPTRGPLRHDPASVPGGTLPLPAGRVPGDGARWRKRGPQPAFGRRRARPACRASGCVAAGRAGLWHRPAAAPIGGRRPWLGTGGRTPEASGRGRAQTRPPASRGTP